MIDLSYSLWDGCFRFCGREMGSMALLESAMVEEVRLLLFWSSLINGKVYHELHDLLFTKSPGSGFDSGIHLFPSLTLMCIGFQNSHG